MGASYYDHLEWIENGIGSLNNTPRYVIDELLICTPALDVSARSAGLIDRFRIKDSDDAEVLFGELTEGVNIFTSSKLLFASSSDEVERILIENELLNGEFWRNGEFVVYTIPSETKRQVKTLVEELSQSNVGLKEQKQKLIQNKFQRVDALFRHIRNSLAHGAFQVVEVEGVDMMILQDGNSSQAIRQISSRMVISMDRLANWRTLFRRLEVEGV